MPEPMFMKLGTYNMTPDPVSKGNFIYPAHHSVCLYVYLSNIARQRLGKNLTAAMNTQRTTEELLEASFSMRSITYKKKVDD
jgi:hypothetical protein